MATEIATLQSQVRALQQQLTERRTILVETLAPEPIVVTKPFRVELEPSEEGFRASFTEANLMAFGDTGPEALLNLKDLVVATFLALLEAGDEHLARGPAQQLAVLRHFMRA